MNRARFLTLCFALFPVASGLKAQELPQGSPQWSDINSKVVEEIQNADLGTLARQVLAAPEPKTPAEWLRKLAILRRADYRSELLTMLARRPKFLTKNIQWTPGYFLNGQAEEDRELALRFYEAFPEESPYSWGEAFWLDWAKESSRKTVDSWLARRAQEQPRVWFRVHLRYRAALGTEAELLAPLEARVRANPESYEAAEAYYLAVKDLPKRPDTSWLATVCKPRLAVERYQLAGMLGNPTAAIPLLESLQDTALTPEDLTWYQGFLLRNPFRHHIGRFTLTSELFQGWVQSGLLENYRATGQTAKAQALMERMAKAFPNGIPVGNFAATAGQIQASSGARVIETTIKRAESENQDSPAYWHARGKYYAGRREFAEAKQAFEKAQERAPFTDDDRHERKAILLDYYELIVHETNQYEQALPLLYNELKKIPLSSRLAIALMSRLASDNDGSFIKRDDPLYWQYLESNDDWTYDHLLLMALLRNDSDEALKRLEALVQKLPKTRAAALGFALYRQKNDTQAIFWMEEALRAGAQSAFLNPQGYLWELYLRTNAWKKAEELHYYPAGHAPLPLCLAAARAGDRAAAMRFYRQWVNLDRRELSAIDTLDKLGFRPELQALYRQIIREEPRCYLRERLLKSPYAFLVK